jgi:phosphoribosylglycinamide formyltransferase 1
VLVNKPNNNIIIFASGQGSNAIAIWQHAQHTTSFNIAAIFCNNINAGIIQFCNNNNINCEVFTNDNLKDHSFLNTINKYDAQIIVLAGFLQKIPEYLISAYPNKIINIHPALLPKYGGTGMYGKYVHAAVFKNKDAETGITIHYVNAQYDEGAIIFQAQTALTKNDTVDIIAQKVLALEHLHYKNIITQLLESL